MNFPQLPKTVLDLCVFSCDFFGSGLYQITHEKNPLFGGKDLLLELFNQASFRNKQIQASNSFSSFPSTPLKNQRISPEKMMVGSDDPFLLKCRPFSWGTNSLVFWGVTSQPKNAWFLPRC